MKKKKSLEWDPTPLPKSPQKFPQPQQQKKNPEILLEVFPGKKFPLQGFKAGKIPKAKIPKAKIPKGRDQIQAGGEFPGKEFLLKAWNSREKEDPGGAFPAIPAGSGSRRPACGEREFLGIPGIGELEFPGNLGFQGAMWDPEFPEMWELKLFGM